MQVLHQDGRTRSVDILKTECYKATLQVEVLPEKWKERDVYKLT